jgi:hypothetical protein
MSATSFEKFAAFEEAARIGGEIAQERVRQVEKFGIQNHPDGTSEDNAWMASFSRDACDAATKAGCLTWLDILREETEEAAAEENPEKLRVELLQIAAVAVAWIEDLDRRAKQASATGRKSE